MTAFLSNDYMTAFESRSTQFGLYAVQLSDGGWSIADGPGTTLCEPDEIDVAGWHLPVRFETSEGALSAIASGPDVFFDVGEDSAWTAHSLRRGAVRCAAYEMSPTT